MCKREKSANLHTTNDIVINISVRTQPVEICLHTLVYCSMCCSGFHAHRKRIKQTTPWKMYVKTRPAHTHSFFVQQIIYIIDRNLCLEPFEFAPFFAWHHQRHKVFFCSINDPLYLLFLLFIKLSDIVYRRVALNLISLRKKDTMN